MKIELKYFYLHLSFEIVNTETQNYRNLNEFICLTGRTLFIVLEPNFRNILRIICYYVGPTAGILVQVNLTVPKESCSERKKTQF